MITSLSEFYFRSKRFILLVQTKKVISMSYGSSISSWKPLRWVRLDLIFSMRDIYIKSNLNPLRKFPSSSRSTKLKDIPPWNIILAVWGKPDSIQIQFNSNSSRATLTSWGEGPSLALVANPSSDSVTIKMFYGIDVSHWPASHPVFPWCWLKLNLDLLLDQLRLKGDKHWW